jgi:hypothetical protein
MADIEAVWGSKFPEKGYNMASKYAKKEPVRDAEKEGRIYPTPFARTAAAVKDKKKIIDDLSHSLAIARSDEEIDTNYAPARVPSTAEHMSNFSSTKSGYTKLFTSPDAGTDFAYAPTAFQESANEIKLNRILAMIEQNRTGYESPSSHDMMLYIFTGVFFLFTLDTFVTLGRRMK